MGVGAWVWAARAAVRRVTLTRNYRSHPAMLYLASHFFYRDALIAMADRAQVDAVLGWSELPNPQFPIMFGPSLHEASSPPTTHTCMAPTLASCAACHFQAGCQCVPG
jgi:hypothetical protein